MQRDLIEGQARHILTALGPIVAMAGILPEDVWNYAAGAVLAAAGMLWSAWDKVRNR